MKDADKNLTIYITEDRCVCCGAIIPEGRQVCVACEKATDQLTSEQLVYDTDIVKDYQSKPSFLDRVGEFINDLFTRR